MNVEIRTRGFSITEGLRAYVERRLAFAFDRQEDRIVRVTVTLADVNGPKGGLDKSCRIEARIRGGRTVSTTVVDSDAYAAIAAATRRAGRGVARTVERERTVLLALFASSPANSGPQA